MTKQGTILVVDDNKGILTAVQMLLGTYFEKVITISTPNKIKATLHDENIDVVLLDMNFSAGINTGNEGLFWLSEIKKEDASIQVVLFTAYADIDLAVRGIKEGAADFVVKPWDNAKLLETLKTAYNIRTANRKGISIATDKLVVSKESGMFWGESNAMQQLRSLIEKVARTDANILVTGENGTGKEMLAREIHLLSNRKKETLVPVDMGAITETLFESELFGHVKGAFTDARADRPGKFEVANKGTLFLDEIGNLSYHLQAKLLTALQRRSIVRVGSNTPIPVNIRLICATNRDLQEMVQKGDFREDALSYQYDSCGDTATQRTTGRHRTPYRNIPFQIYQDIWKNSHVSQPGCQREAESATLVREYPGTRTHNRKSRHHCRKECVGRQRFRFSTGEKKAGDKRGDNLGRDGI